MIPLVREQREAIAEHCQRLNVRRLEVFGSAARGDFNPEKSDLDFLVDFADDEKPGIFDRYFDLVNSLEALFNRPVDLVTVGSIKNPYFRASLEATKEPVYVS
jgi:predicted nucleotidyltransferase